MEKNPHGQLYYLPVHNFPSLLVTFPFHLPCLSVVWPRAYTTVLSPNGDSCQQIMTVGDAVTIDHIANIPQNWRQVWQLNSPSFLQLGKYFLLPGLSGEVSSRLSLPPLPLPGDSEESVLAQLFRGILNNPQQSSTILNNPRSLFRICLKNNNYSKK